MAGFDYAKSAQTADRLIKRFGQTGALLKKDAGSGRATFTPHPVSLVVLDYAADQIDGTRITSRDRQIYISAIGTPDITAADQIQDAAGVQYAVIPPVRQLNPAGTRVLWEIQARA